MPLLFWENGLGLVVYIGVGCLGYGLKRLGLNWNLGLESDLLPNCLLIILMLLLP